MRQVLWSGILSAVVLLAPTTARAQTLDVIQTCKDVVEALANLGTGNPIGAVSKGIDALLGTLKAKEAALNAQEMEALKRTVRALQVACSEIPALRAQLADLRVELDQKADKKEVERLLKELRADVDVELRKLNARVGKVESRVGKLESRVENHEGRLVDVEMQEALVIRAHLLLATGGQVENVVLADKPDAKGVWILTATGRKKHYKPGEVSVVEVRAGKYQWIESKARFVFHARGAEGSDTVAGDRPAPQFPDNDSREKKDSQLLVIMETMNPAQLDDLRAYGERRGYEWDKIGLGKKLDLVKLKLQQDYRDEIRKMQQATNCSELQALRILIHRLAQEAQASAVAAQAGKSSR